MPIRDLAAQDASLDNDYGTTRGPNAAASHNVALFIGDPMDGGVEQSGGGYARVALPASGWQPSNNGYKSPTSAIQFPPTSGEWNEGVTHWALFAGSVMWDCGPLTEALDVTAASTVGPLLTFAVYYDEAVTGP